MSTAGDRATTYGRPTMSFEIGSSKVSRTTAHFEPLQLVSTSLSRLQLRKRRGALGSISE
jgi:hypothetical protein